MADSNDPIDWTGQKSEPRPQGAVPALIDQWQGTKGSPPRCERSATTTISLEQWSIKYQLRERRTALADCSSASYHFSASVVLALEPAPKLMPDRRKTQPTKPIPLAGTLRFPQLWILRFKPCCNLLLQRLAKTS
jgi:hypothetical protein